MTAECPRCGEYVDPLGGTTFRRHQWHIGCLTDHQYDVAKDYDGHATDQDVRVGDGVGDRYRDPDGHAALEYRCQIANTQRART